MPLKSIEFNFPIYRDGQEVRRLLWEKGNTVETVVLLTHEKATSYIEVTMDYDTIVSEYKPKVKVTYKMIMDYIKEKYNFNVHSTTIAEIKRSLGLKVGDYNKKDDANYRKEKITPEKRKAVEETLRHFEIIQ